MPVPGPAPAHGRFVVTADVLIDGTGSPAIPSPAVTIVDGRIVTVQHRGEGWSPPADVELVDGTGGTLLPGLIDAHVHLAFPDRGSPPDREALVRGATERARAAISGGVTTVRDLGSADGAALAVRDDVAARRVTGARILAAGAAGGHDPHGALQLVRACGRHGPGVAGRHRGPGRGGCRRRQGHGDRRHDYEGEQSASPPVHAGRNSPRPWTSPIAAACALPPMPSAPQACGSRSVPASTRSSTARRSPARCRHRAGGGRGDRPVGAVGSVSAHEALRSLLPDTDGRGGDLVEMRRRLVPHRALAAAGVPMVVHSDAGPGPTRFEEFARSVRVIQAGMDASPVAAIAFATGRAAAALGLGGDLGYWSAGRGRPAMGAAGDAASGFLRGSGGSSRVWTVVLDGRVLEPAG